MSDTPETDKIAHAGLPERAYISEMTHKARKLERERDKARTERDELNKEIEALRITLNTTAKHLHNTNQSRNAYAINFRKSEVKRLEVENERDALQRISDEAIANELNIRAERDEAMKERNAALSDRDAWARMCGAVDCYTPSTAEPYEALKLQRDALRAEVNQLKAERDNWRVSSVCRELNAELERLKAELAAMKGAE
jgi:chromosome segregation ATPase